MTKIELNLNPGDVARSALKAIEANTLSAFYVGEAEMGHGCVYIDATTGCRCAIGAALTDDR